MLREADQTKEDVSKLKECEHILAKVQQKLLSALGLDEEELGLQLSNFGSGDTNYRSVFQLIVKRVRELKLQMDHI